MVLPLLMLTFKIIKFHRQGKDLEKVKQRLIEIANHVDKVSSLGVIKSLTSCKRLGMRWREWNIPHLTSEGQLLPLVPNFPFLWRLPGLGVAAGDAPTLSGPRWPWDPPPSILVSPAGSWTRWHMWPSWKHQAGLPPGLPGRVPQASWGSALIDKEPTGFTVLWWSSWLSAQSAAGKFFTVNSGGSSPLQRWLQSWTRW